MSAPLEPVRALMAGLIDYAGLFPPAALDMASAVRNFDAHRRGEHGWMLGRFVVPFGRVAELESMAPAPFPLAVLASAADSLDHAFDAMEFRADDPARIGANLPSAGAVYFEIPAAALELIPALARIGARAKVRTGGLTPDAVPPAPAVARFVLACVAHSVSFKATAGLHHALRAGAAHGFLNLFLAAALAWRGGDEPSVLATLEETSAGAFRFDSAGVGWHGHRLSAGDLADARARFAIGFGSCSFEEPVEDLKTLGLL